MPGCEVAPLCTCVQSDCRQGQRNICTRAMAVQCDLAGTGWGITNMLIPEGRGDFQAAKPHLRSKEGEKTDGRAPAIPDRLLAVLVWRCSVDTFILASPLLRGGGGPNCFYHAVALL